MSNLERPCHEVVYEGHIDVEDPEYYDDEPNCAGELKKKKKIAQVETSCMEEEPEAIKQKIDEEEAKLPAAAAMAGDSVVTQPKPKPPPLRCVYEVYAPDNQLVKAFDMRYEAIPVATECGGYVKACYYSVGEGNKEEQVFHEIFGTKRVLKTWGSPSTEKRVCDICDGRHLTQRCAYKTYVRPGEKFDTKLPNPPDGYIMVCRICGYEGDEKGGCCGNYDDNWGIATVMSCLACGMLGDHRTRDCTKKHLLPTYEMIEKWADFTVDDEEFYPRDDSTDKDPLPMRA